MKNAIKSSIILRGLEVNVHLGWPDAERAIQQKIMIDLHIQFSKPPLACRTDHLDDTFCYDSLVTAIQKNLLLRPFRLIEHVGAEIYLFVSELLVDKIISVRVTKKPPIQDLTGGVTFCYGDADNAWSF